MRLMLLGFEGIGLRPVFDEQNITNHYIQPVRKKQKANNWVRNRIGIICDESPNGRKLPIFT
jgi:hypothetical protein